MVLYSELFRARYAGRSWAVSGAGLIALAFGLLLILKALPYSSVRLAPVEALEAARAPTPDFALGPLRWPVGELAAAPALRPFRDAMRATCGDAKGVPAAICATCVLSQRTPIGDPTSEFVNTRFDPVAHFERHLAGAPGHCLTRSAILATQLLAVGVPARVVQLVPARAKGHTLVEVWDDTLGWTMVDPSTGGFVTGAARRASAADLLADPASVEWKPFGGASPATSESEAKKHYFQALLAGNVLYPEPWLYLRTGARVATWPLRGHYARVGPAFLALGPIQTALVFLIPGMALAGISLVVVGWRRRRAVREVWGEPVRADVRPLRELDALPPS